MSIKNIENKGSWLYNIEKGSCMDFHVTAKCSNCGWDWYSQNGIGNPSYVFSAFVTNGDSMKEVTEQFLLVNAKNLNKFICCPCCATKDRKSVV